MNLKYERDPVEQAVLDWECAIEKWKKVAVGQARKSARFKAWEASQKKVHMRNKTSAVMAETIVKSGLDWETRFAEVTIGDIEVEAAKKMMDIARAKWETGRTNAVTLRSLQ